MARRYPLEILQKLRARRVDERAGELAASLRERGRAEHVAVGAADAVTAAAAAARAVRDDEATRIDDGLGKASDFTRQREWERGVALRAEQLRAEQFRAEQELASREQGVQQARRALGAADAESRLVDEHAARWRSERLVAELEREAEAAEDNVAARRERDD